MRIAASDIANKAIGKLLAAKGFPKQTAALVEACDETLPVFKRCSIFRGMEQLYAAEPA